MRQKLLAVLISSHALVCTLTPLFAAERGATKPLNLPLPDPLIAADGHRITSAEEWTKIQRPHLLELFRTNEYGRNTVDRPEHLKFEVGEENPSTFQAKARRKLVR